MHKSIKNHIIIVALLIAVTIPLRFTDLGYSEFQDDEKKAFFRPPNNVTTIDFFLSRRKGPMQFVVSYIPYLITQDFRNEFAQRLPFTIANTLSVAVLYLLLFKLTRNYLASIFGTLFYITNGFIVGFSRIAQYQNLNLLFSFSSLYFYAHILDNKRRIFSFTLLGTLFFSLSFLSHWDAVYVLVPIIYFFVKFLLRDDISKQYKKRVLIYNFVLGCLLLLPFLIPFVLHHSASPSSVDYFTRRYGASKYGLELHEYIFELYNPFFTLPVYLVLLGLSALVVRYKPLFFIWFIVNFIAIRFFMINPGTHVYNYLLPLIFLYTLLSSYLLTFLSVKLKYLFAIVMFVVCGVFYYQSYMIFVDHTVEYPWEAKVLFGYETTPYVNKGVFTFGFPHFRNWKGMNAFLLKYNDSCSYITNEGKEISEYYMDLKYGKEKDCFYTIKIKRPFISTRDGVVFADTNHKIFQYNARGTPLSRIYVKGLN